MKKYFYFILFILAVSINAQSDEHMVATTSYSYNNYTMEWSYSYRTVINYYENGFRLEDFNYSWDGNNWIFNSSSAKQEYSYNPLGNLSVQINSGWSENGWDPYWRYSHMYDTEGNLMLYLAEQWNGTEWSNWSKTDYYRSEDFYDFIQSTWISGNYENRTKGHYTYGSNGLIDQCIYSTWHDSDWSIASRRTYTYDANNNLTEELWEEYSDEVYNPSYRFVSQFDAYNNQTNEVRQSWDASRSQWKDDYRYTTTFNEKNQKTYFLYEAWGGYFWTPVSKSEYEYSTATDIDEPEELSSDYRLFNNYPNPFNPTTKINYSLPESSEIELSIHSSTGEKIATLYKGVKSAGQHSHTFDAGDLASGIYFYKLVADNFVEVKKMILMK